MYSLDSPYTPAILVYMLWVVIIFHGTCITILWLRVRELRRAIATLISQDVPTLGPPLPGASGPRRIQ